MTRVFKNRIDKYSRLKYFQNNYKSSNNENYFYRSNIDMKFKKLANHNNNNYFKRDNFKSHKNLIERNNLCTNISGERNNTFDKQKKFAQIKKLFEHKNNVSPQKNIVLI